MRTLLSGLCIFIASTLCAQRQCATSEYIQFLSAQDPLLASRISTIEHFIQQQITAARTGDENIRIIRIPVVVHVLYNSEAQNLSDAQVQSQIQALNRDFRRLNWDTVNTPARFKSLAADVQIEFALATADPEGVPTNGIIRKQTNIAYWNADDKIKMTAQGGDDPWNSQSYLNIWVGNLRSLLGYSSVVGCSSDKDGVVINFSAFGTINRAAPYHLGRTTVHEVAHWLGLKHIWGDTYCGDDAIDDTPTQGNFTAGCPNTFRSSCSNGTTGDMYMNYMDYTDDACVNLFTLGQKNRMQALFNTGGPRYALLSSRGLETPWKEPSALPPAVAAAGFQLYPNPAAGQLTVQFNHDLVGKNFRLLDNNGRTLKLTTITTTQMHVQLGQLPAGLYFIQLMDGGTLKSQKFLKK